MTAAHTVSCEQEPSALLGPGKSASRQFGERVLVCGPSAEVMAGTLAAELLAQDQCVAPSTFSRPRTSDSGSM